MCSAINFTSNESVMQLAQLLQLSEFARQADLQHLQRAAQLDDLQRAAHLDDLQRAAQLDDLQRAAHTYSDDVQRLPRQSSGCKQTSDELRARRDSGYSEQRSTRQQRPRLEELQLLAARSELYEPARQRSMSGGSTGSTECLSPTPSFSSCDSAPASPTLLANSQRYKTELCRQFAEGRNCKYGDKCQFAHGVKEVRNVMRHPKYKTDMCRNFNTTGFCPYGPRCHFVHNVVEARVFSVGRPILPSNQSLSPSTPSAPSTPYSPQTVSHALFPTAEDGSDRLHPSPVEDEDLELRLQQLASALSGLDVATTHTHFAEPLLEPRNPRLPLPFGLTSPGIGPAAGPGLEGVFSRALASVIATI